MQFTKEKHVSSMEKQSNKNINTYTEKYNFKKIFKLIVLGIFKFQNIIE